MRYSSLWIIPLGLLLAIFTPFIGYSKSTHQPSKPSVKSIFKPSIVEQTKRSVVAVDARVALTPYTMPGNRCGSGVVIDKEAGYILTSGYIVGPVLVAEYTTCFFNGVEIPAKMLYYDLWCDYAILKVDPLAIPKEVPVVKLSNKQPMVGEAVFTISKGKKQKAVLYSGSIDDINYGYDLWLMPQHFIRVGVTNSTRAHGSLFFNEAGEGVALNCCGSATIDLGLRLDYIHDALAALKQQQLPVRKHIGALLTLYSLNDAIRYDYFTEASQTEYLRHFPHAQNKILQVKSVLKGTPAAGKLLPGDLIWAVNSKPVGPSLVDFDLAMSRSTSNYLSLTIFRNGHYHDIVLPLYPLDNHRITKMVQFGGTIFFEADDYLSRLAGVPPKTLVSCIAQSNTIFNAPYISIGNLQILGMRLLTVNGQPVQTLDGLTERIPQLVHQKYFTVEYINYLHSWRENELSVAHDQYKINVEYNMTLSPPTLWIWDPIQLEWKAEAISIKNNE